MTLKMIMTIPAMNTAPPPRRPDHSCLPPLTAHAQVHGLGVEATQSDLPAELTITADGAFWGHFGPTVRDGRIGTDLLITRTATPLEVPARALLGLIEDRPPGTDATLNIR